jgi:hypothetical protein
LESEWSGVPLQKKPQRQLDTFWIKTMQDIIFATFLYSAMICFVCCLRYQPSCPPTVATDITDLSKDEQNQADINQALTDEPEQKLEAAQVIEPVVSVEEEVLLKAGTQDTSKLTLRQCRAVIREINKGLPKVDRIRQKINGKDAPTDWLRGQIARYLEIHPTRANSVAEVLKAC